MSIDRPRTFLANTDALSSLLDKAEHEAFTRRAVRDAYRLSIRRLHGASGGMVSHLTRSSDGAVLRATPGDRSYEIGIDGTIAATLVRMGEDTWCLAMETRHVRLAAAMAAEAIEDTLLALLDDQPLPETASAAFDAWKAEHSAGAPARHTWLMGAFSPA